jgi:subfamily B ATP-binding cassette protein MsbA
MPGPVIELIAAVGVGAVLWFGGKQVFDGEILAGELIAFMVALGLLNEPLKGISKIHSLTQQALSGAESLFAILDHDSDVVDHGTDPAPSEPGPLSFQGVCFDYGDSAVLNELTFEVPAGSVVAIVGASGSGKSTIAKLIPRLLDPTAGRILINGCPTASFSLESLRRRIALVSQDTFLFNASVSDNIRFGSTATQTAVEEAARAANAHAFIERMPQGYDTPIDELGQRLSGGQRQRLCIARAILRDAPLLILDEATSALDPESESLVNEALGRLMKGRTVLAIAHRPSTIHRADRILVLENGSIQEQGSHTELMAKTGTYRSLMAPN